MRAVILLLHAQLRQHAKSWLALAALVALVGGLVMAAATTGRRTAAAFPDFVARHGYDSIVYSGHPLPSLSRIPQVAQVTPVRAPFIAAVRCRGCGRINASSTFDAFELSPAGLARTVRLLSGRMPDQGRPDEVLASATFADDSGSGSARWFRSSRPPRRRSLRASRATSTWRRCPGTTCGWSAWW